MKSKKILVVGDLAIDRYHRGPTKGLSPEGPYVTVLNPEQELNLGCAANAARNIKCIFPKIDVDMMASVGNDSMATTAKDLLAWRGVGSEHVLEQKTCTTVKNRLVTNGTVVARWDVEDYRSVKTPLAFVQRMANIASDYDCIVFSDYNKGAVFRNLIITAIKNKKPNCKILVDPKQRFEIYKGVDLLKPNLKELHDYYDSSALDDYCLGQSCHGIIEKYGIKNVLLTKSEHGMTLHSAAGQIGRYRAKAKSCFDVTGAGDIVMATIAGFSAQGDTLQTACKYASIAAGISVGKFGTSTVSMAEIMEELKCQDSIQG